MAFTMISVFSGIAAFALWFVWLCSVPTEHPLRVLIGAIVATTVAVASAIIADRLGE